MKILRMFRIALVAGCLATGTAIVTTGCGTTEESSAQAAADAVISNRVVDALRATSDYKFIDVVVNTYNGKVQLSGFVDSGHHKDQAEVITKQVDGVHDVVNNILVK